ncbi:MAG: DNA adenine methylase [Prolixibacteraceae bacterium]
MKRTPITYYGGKQSMLDVILPKIPKHKIYVEPFFGGGAVFFAKPPSYLEVINDKNERLITFYEVMRDHFVELNEMITGTLHSEAMYYRAKDIYNERIPGSRLEIAWSVWVITNMSFSASMHGGWKWCNGSAGSHTGRFVSRKKNDFKQLQKRLENVQISSRDALRVIKDRDTDETFFYLDPPYPGSVQGHYNGYTMKDFSQLLETITGIKGKFLLSNFWSQTLKYFTVKNQWTAYQKEIIMKVANFSGRRYKTEILISNYITESNLFTELETRNVKPETIIEQ